MAVLITVPSRRTIFKAMESTIGLTEEYSKDLGTIIKWKVKEYSLGPTAEDMRVTTKMTRRRVKANSSGLMEESMKVAGKTESSMAWVPTLQPVENLSKASGLMVRDSTGSLQTVSSSNDNAYLIS